MSSLLNASFAEGYRDAVEALLRADTRRSRQYELQDSVYDWSDEGQFWAAVQMELEDRFNELAFWGAVEQSMIWHARRA